MMQTSTHKQRQLTVRKTYHDYQLRRSYQKQTPVGEIHLKGNWLIKAGFTIGAKVAVQVRDGCIVVTVE